MNGPDHYRHAEARLKLAVSAKEVDDVVTYNLAMAQVHATLALVAATVEPAGWQPGEFPGWREAVK